MHSWVLLVYKVAPEPSARRVYVWRKLKRLGALLLHDAIWVLPATPYTHEQLQWLAAEIEEMDGSAQVWEAHPSLAAHDDELVRRFLAQVEAAYREIAAELERPSADAAALAKRYQQVQQQDYFHSALGAQVREALASAHEAGEAGEGAEEGGGSA
jgi:Protein ChrB, N-terminal